VSPNPAQAFLGRGGGNPGCDPVAEGGQLPMKGKAIAGGGAFPGPGGKTVAAFQDGLDDLPSVRIDLGPVG
jgi:hypothetical protein